MNTSRFTLCLASVRAFVKANRGKSLVLGLTGLYLLWQASLSAAILSAATPEVGQRLNDLARYTLGFGSALLIFRIGYFRGFLLPLVAVAALCAGYGAIRLEDAVVRTLAEQTSPEERRDAKLVLLFNEGVKKGGVRLTELSSDVTSDPVRVRALLTVMGFAVWKNPQLMAQVRELGQGVLDALALPAVYARIDQGYDQYLRVMQDKGEKLPKLQHAIKTADFAKLASFLNKELVRYAACKNDNCREKVQNRVNRAVEESISPTVQVSLEQFCTREEKPVDYSGIIPENNSVKYYAITAEGMRGLVVEEIEKRVQAVVREESRRMGLPANVELAIPADRILDLPQWRERLKATVPALLAEQRQKWLAPADVYAPGAERAAEGLDNAVAVFLPPVALGFSVVVCFLHVTNVLVLAWGRARLFSAAALVVLLAPALLTSSAIPLSGLAGTYARWLMFWETVMYPFGIFRALIL